MAFLHENKSDFLYCINMASQNFSVLPHIVEKDYYVTMILRGLAEHLDFIVFKGGTSLSKCHKVIKRFSEDIDITIDNRLSQGQMKNLKKCIKGIAVDLGMTIPNIEDTRSRRSYNRYVMQYDSVLSASDEIVQNAVLMETSFAEVSFPTVPLLVRSYIGDIVKDEAPDELKNLHLDPFGMKVQGIDRTLVDKVYAICDYYLQNRVRKHSRHIYDIYKLLPLVPMDESFRKLVQEVREVRKMTNICPSAQDGVNVPALLDTIISEEVYRQDYEVVTSRILEENVDYDAAIKSVAEIASSGMFR